MVLGQQALIALQIQNFLYSISIYPKINRNLFLIKNYLCRNTKKYKQDKKTVTNFGLTTDF